MATPNSSPPTQREGARGNFVIVIQTVLNNNGFTKSRTSATPVQTR